MFRIVFEGDPNKKTLWGVSLDTIFTVVTTILIFILGYIITKIIESRKEKRRLKEIEEYFIKTVQMMTKPIEKQKRGLLSFAKILKKNKEQHLVLEDVSGIEIKQLREITSKDLFTIFVRNKKGEISFKTELYGKLRSQLEYIEVVKKSLEGDLKSFLKYHEKFVSVYKENLQQVNELLEEFISEKISSAEQPNSELFLFKVNRIRLAWIKKEDKEYTDMFVSFEKFVRPVQELCQKEQYDKIVSVIVKPIMGCVYAYHDIKELRWFYRRHFLVEAKGLQTSLFKINEALGDFEKM